MAENSISQVGRLDPDIASKMVQEVAVHLEYRSKQVDVPAFSQEIAKQMKTEQKIEQKAEPDTTRAEGSSSSTKTALRFQVDMKTHDVTIMIVDKATDKVIATVPAEAIKNIPSGQLLHYSA